MAEHDHGLERVPTDVAGDDLVRTYARGIARLERLVRAALTRGLDPRRVGTPEQQRGDATAAYRARQLQQARLILAELDAAAAQHGRAATARAYAANLVAIDRVLDRRNLARTGLAGRFGGVHQAQVEALAANLEQSLRAAARQAGENVEAVFARANTLEGALTPGRSPLGGFPFIGRRVDDPWRRVALETIGAGTVALDTRRQISAQLARQLIEEGITDALTGFVDRAGRRWNLATYAETVVRTTTREASSRATVARLAEHGQELAAVTSHPHKADECSPYDGKTFALPGTDAARAGRYPVLEVMPPFHPRCRHVLAPAAASFDEYLDALEVAVAEQAAPAPDEPAFDPGAARRAELEARLDAVEGMVTAAAGRERDYVRAELAAMTRTAEERPPFGDAARPFRDENTEERLEAQRIAQLIAADPGPDRDALEALVGDLEKIERRALREQRRTAKIALGESLFDEVDRKKWAREDDVLGRFMRGELDRQDVETLAYEAWQDAEARRERRNTGPTSLDYGFKKKPLPCDVCGKFKAMPADVCQFCGNDPVPLGITFFEFNREFGYGGDNSRAGMYGREFGTSQWNG